MVILNFTDSSLFETKNIVCNIQKASLNFVFLKSMEYPFKFLGYSIDNEKKKIKIKRNAS